MPSGISHSGCDLVLYGTLPSYIDAGYALVNSEIELAYLSQGQMLHLFSSSILVAIHLHILICSTTTVFFLNIVRFSVMAII